MDIPHIGHVLIARPAWKLVLRKPRRLWPPAALVRI